MCCKTEQSHAKDFGKEGRGKNSHANMSSPRLVGGSLEVLPLPILQEHSKLTRIAPDPSLPKNGGCPKSKDGE